MTQLGTTRRDAIAALGLLAIGTPAPAHAEPVMRPGPGVPRRDAGLRRLLGLMPPQPRAEFSILETVDLEGGKRLKIEYLAEDPYLPLHEPEDRIRAYLFVPAHEKGARLSAVLALHQDGPQTHIGKLEPAGLAGDANLHYGLELFRRGHVVLCPDRFYHAERRRGVAPASIDPERDLSLLSHRVGQLLLKGRTALGKEAFDCIVGMNILASLPYVDPARVGGVGHSAGGLALMHWAFIDPRVRASVSSCGLFDVVRFYDEGAPKRRSSDFAIPGLALIGNSSDYLAGVAPRAVLLTRGLWEWGSDAEWRQASLDHVAETRRMVASALGRYRSRNAAEMLEAIYFDEGGGNHDFPPGVRQRAYAWLDRQLEQPASLV